MTTTTTTVYLLTGDIGGTNSRLSLYAAPSSSSTPDSPLVEHTFTNRDEIPEAERSNHKAFIQHIIQPFLKDYCWGREAAKLEDISQVRILACVASAGVVDTNSNSVQLTNLDNLLIDGNDIAMDKSSIYMEAICQCTIINDFVAQGYGCLTLQDDDVVQLYGPKITGRSSILPTTGPKVCVGAGTGLGECYLTPNTSAGSDTTYTCFASEGGHVDYAARDPLSMELLQHLQRKLLLASPPSSETEPMPPRVSVERVVSGIGLADVYDFLAQSKYPDRADTAVLQEFLSAKDQGRVVGENATTDELCALAMKIMMTAYGCEVGNAAIKFIPTGGLFVTGGLTSKNKHHIMSKGGDTESDFLRAYRDKGRVSTIIRDKVPLFLVKAEDLGVRGVHKAACTLYNNYAKDHAQL
jgi:glucokinase